jgi:D-alanyl-D-alanine carboxypeptidase
MILRSERIAVASLAVLSAACSTPVVEPTRSTRANIEPDAETVANGPAPRSAACAAMDAKLQAALDGARTSRNAVLAVKNTDCGTSVYVSGDENNATKTSLWRIGSITKTFTTATVLSLVAEKKLSLDDPLDKFVPNVAEGVTVRMLLNHTSGIFSYTDSPEFSNTATFTPEQLVQLAADNPPYFPAGQGYEYSNTNFVLLGMIAEIAGGAPIGKLVRARAIEKAKLRATFFDGEETLGGTLARAFGDDGEDVTTALNPSGPWAAGAIVASGADLAEWTAALFGSNEILDNATRSLMTANPVDNGAYGLGTEILSASESAGAGPGVGHTGEVLGFQSQAFYFSEHKTTIAAVVNAEAASPDDISRAAASALFAR